MAKQPTGLSIPDSIKESPRTSEALADLIVSRFRVAQRWRATERIGNRSVDAVLRQCYDQYNGVLDPCDQQLVEESGIDLYVSLTKYKVDVLVAWIRDLMMGTSESPFLVEPTPLPDLTKQGQAEAVQAVKQLFFGEMAQTQPEDPEAMLAIVKRIKEETKRQEQKIATKRAENMQELIDDQLVHGDFRHELLAFITDFCTYPYAVMVGPLPEYRTAFKWSGESPKVVQEPTLITRQVSPFDYFWSPDSSAAGKGTFDIIRERTNKKALLDAASLPSYIAKNIERVLEDGVTGRVYPDWMSRNPDEAAREDVMMGWDTLDVIEQLHYFGQLRGSDIKEYFQQDDTGKWPVEDDKYYEVEAIVIGNWVVKLVLNPNPDITARPVFTASYQRVNGKIPGYGLAQNLRDIERGWLAAYRAVLENLSYSVAPLGEVDIGRIQRYMNVEDLGRPLPRTMVPTDPDYTQGGRPAHYFHSIPNITQQVMYLMSVFLEYADRFTGIPAALSGQPVGTGVNRTFRGITMLYGNALKGVQSALMNVDIQLLEGVGRAYFNLNMMYSDDPDVKGDSEIKVRGTSGLFQKEIAKQQAQENLMVLAQIAQIPGAVPPTAMKYLVEKVLKDLGIPEDKLEELNLPNDQAAMQGAGDEMGGEVPQEMAGQPLPQ